jgi:hypothetical protein
MNDKDIERFLRRSDLIDQLLEFIEKQEDIPEEFQKILEEEWEELLLE